MNAPSRKEIADLLASIGPPEEKREEKYEAVKKLGLKNFQGHGVELTLETYKEY